jgi:hypothetical protein
VDAPVAGAASKAAGPGPDDYGFPKEPPLVDRPDITALTHEAGGNVRVWRVGARAELWNMRDVFKLRLCVGKPRFTSDGSRLGVGTMYAYICDAETGAAQAIWYRSSWSGLPVINFSKDGRRMLAAGSDGSTNVDAALRVLEVVPVPHRDGTPNRLDQLVGAAPNTTVYSADLSPDGRTYAWSGGLWRVSGPRQLIEFGSDGDPYDERVPRVRCVRFDADGRRVAVGYADERGNRSYTRIWAVPEP